jgi:hypothetical protein
MQRLELSILKKTDGKVWSLVDWKDTHVSTIYL